MKLEDILTITPRKITEKGYTYTSFEVNGTYMKQRIRKRCPTQEAAEKFKQGKVDEWRKAAPEAKRITVRLTEEQVSECEAFYLRMREAGRGESLGFIADWFLKHYIDPKSKHTVATSYPLFLEAQKEVGIKDPTSKSILKRLADFCPNRQLHEYQPEHLKEFLDAESQKSGGWSGTTRAGYRKYLSGFFNWAVNVSKITTHNPVLAMNEHIRRRFNPENYHSALPECMTLATVEEVMRRAERYEGYGVVPRGYKPGPDDPPPPPTSWIEPGRMVPYFALCLFGSLRPGFQKSGEARRLHELDPQVLWTKVIDLDRGIIDLPRNLTKTKKPRVVPISDNLRAWLAPWAEKKLPLLPRNARKHIEGIVDGLSIPHDGLRHTYITATVFTPGVGSLVDAALRAGNSEKIIRAHYLDRKLGTPDMALKFWRIFPSASSAQVA